MKVGYQSWRIGYHREFYHNLKRIIFHSNFQNTFYYVHEFRYKSNTKLLVNFELFFGTFNLKV